VIFCEQEVPLDYIVSNIRRHEIEEMMYANEYRSVKFFNFFFSGIIEPLNSGFVLTDPADPRYIYISSLRRHFGEFLHEASKSLLQQGEENTVDAVEMLVGQW
jgi:proteasome activator subunit 4